MTVVYVNTEKRIAYYPWSPDYYEETIIGKFRKALDIYFEGAEYKSLIIDEERPGEFDRIMVLLDLGKDWLLIAEVGAKPDGWTWGHWLEIIKDTNVAIVLPDKVDAIRIINLCSEEITAFKPLDNE